MNVNDFKVSKPEKFLINILEYYTKNLEKKDFESIEKLKNLIVSFPKINVINKLIDTKQILKKELVLIRLILEIALHYYMNFVQFNKLKFIKIIDIFIKFINSLQNEDIKYLTNKLKDNTELINTLGIINYIIFRT
jgi:hypothetical protein